ncbi:hypothetical protein [Herbidospora yilanensis]|uniref:hypothetical protein n=1 Tax=Herbidospora yilanensis TaxID=354426 RepID=UPI0007864EE0|nr:hypothetical protein [Herbidospora yilanensis]
MNTEQNPVLAAGARLANIRPLTRALVLAGLTAGATLILKSPDTAAGATIALGLEGDPVNPVSVSHK